MDTSFTVIEIEPIFIKNPNATGKSFINGLKINNNGKHKIAINNRLGFCCLVRMNKLINAKYTGIIKKLAPSKYCPTRAHIINQIKIRHTLFPIASLIERKLSKQIPKLLQSCIRQIENDS